MNWRVRLTVTELHPESTHARVSDRYFDAVGDDELAAVNDALAGVFAEASERRSMITGILVERRWRCRKPAPIAG